MLSVGIKKVQEAAGASPRHFIYEEAWQRDETYVVAAVNVWDQRAGDSCLLDLQRNLNHMQTQLNNLKTKKLGMLSARLRKSGRSLNKRSSTSYSVDLRRERRSWHNS